VLIVAGMLRIASTLPGLHHAIRERLAFLPPRLRSPAAFLLLLLPTLPVAALGATAALLWTLLIGTVAAWPSISLRERRAPVAAALLLALSPFALTLWASFVLPGSPGSALHTLWEARTTAGEVSPPRPASAQAPGAEDALRRALVGIRAGNHGDARTALAELRAAVALEPTRWEYRNALGSALLVADDPTGALAQYDRATLLAPREPIPHANRARAWNAQLEFARADAAFRRALERGYRVPETGLDGRTHPDPLPGAATFWEILLRRGAEDFSWAAASRASLSLLVPLRPVWWCVPLFLGALLATRSRRLPRARVCTECGRSVCRKCHFRELRRSLCPECYRLRHRVRTPLARDAALARRRHATLRAERRATLALSVLIPGAGHWTLGRSATALALFAACATVSVSTGSFSLSATALELASLSIVSLILCARATRSRGRSPRGGR
jgi:tetratricopeptide (TPR) repeat protein